MNHLLSPRLFVLYCCTLLFVLLLAGCTSAAAPADTGLTLPNGFRAEVLAATLDRPTQLLAAGTGELWVAQLAGGENAGTGQVVALSLADGTQRVVLDKLLKPTGIALLDGALWVAAGPSLLRAPITGGTVGEPVVVLENLPSNGRSNGTLTVSPAGQLLYETSGSRDGNRPRIGSATLWALDPADPTSPRPLATGLKGAYAHSFDANNQLWATEIGDDQVNGAAPPDELNLIEEGADYGWPQCYGNGEVARNFGGVAAECQRTRTPVALFPPGTTPTSIAVSPWEADTLLVALWNGGESDVVQVRLSGSGSTRSGKVVPFLSGLARAQHVLAMPDASLIVSDFDTGRLYRVTRDSQMP